MIDEVGKGLPWVRQSSKLGHLIIEQVKDGLVVVRDGRRTFELVAERPEKRSLLKEPLSRATGSKSILSASNKAGGRITSSRAPQRNVEETAALQKEQAKLAEKILAELEAMQAGIESEQADSEPNAKEIAAVRENIISSLESTRISAEEAKRLNHLGKKLKDVQQNPNQVKNDRTESDANLSEPNLSEPNSPEEE